jgi:sugar/nucleoside kinase (ribokinase family)
MSNTPELRRRCADKLLSSVSQAARFTAFLGLDGFVDEIIHVVDKRENVEMFSRVPTIARFAERIAGAANRSTNLELVNQLTKLGGNGPIMGNALAALGLEVVYLGALGYPTLHPVFQAFAERARVHTIAEPGHTDALEFEDGKLLLGKQYYLREVTWPNIIERFGREKFARRFGSADLVGFVNWTMIPYMSDIWEAIQTELCPTLTGKRRLIFFDLADPEKRSAKDILRALELILAFEKHFSVILGLNEKEAHEVGRALGIAGAGDAPEGLARLAREICARLPVSTLVIHPVAYALAVSQGQVSMIDGPVEAKPLITTGAGDHFNSGFCLGKLLGFDNASSLLTGVSASGYYVRTGKSPSIAELAGVIAEWPAAGA